MSTAGAPQISLAPKTNGSDSLSGPPLAKIPKLSEDGGESGVKGSASRRRGRSKTPTLTSGVSEDIEGDLANARRSPRAKVAKASSEDGSESTSASPEEDLTLQGDAVSQRPKRQRSQVCGKSTYIHCLIIKKLTKQD